MKPTTCLAGLLSLMLVTSCTKKPSSDATKNKPAEPKAGTMGPMGGATMAPAPRRRAVTPARARPAVQVKLASVADVARYKARRDACRGNWTAISMLGGPDRVKRKKEQLAAGARFGRLACAKGVPQGCFTVWAGVRNRKDAAGKAIAKEFAAKLERLYVQDCQRGNIHACSHLVSEYCVGLSLQKSAPLCKKYTLKVIPMIQGKCDEGDVEYCKSYTLHLRDSESPLHDAKKAKAVLIQARKVADKQCAAGKAESCDWMRSAWKYGHGGAKDAAKVAPLQKKVLALRIKACDKGDSVACVLAASTLQEKGPHQDVAKARKLLIRAHLAFSKRCLSD